MKAFLMLKRKIPKINNLKNEWKFFRIYTSFILLKGGK
jgi:hypothetical protein